MVESGRQKLFDLCLRRLVGRGLERVPKLIALLFGDLRRRRRLLVVDSNSVQEEDVEVASLAVGRRRRSGFRGLLGLCKTVTDLLFRRLDSLDRSRGIDGNAALEADDLGIGRENHQGFHFRCQRLDEKRRLKRAKDRILDRKTLLRKTAETRCTD